MESKVVSSADAAVADLEAGMTIMLGGFAPLQGWPNTLLQAIARHGAGDLTLIGNLLGYGHYSPQVLAREKLIGKFIGSFGGSATRQTLSEDQIMAGDMAFELSPQGTLAERIRAGGAGIAAFYTPTGVGTAVDTPDKERRTINGRPHLLETALRGDFAILRANRADEIGNLQIDGAQQNFHVPAAMAADTVVAEVDEIVPVGSFEPRDVQVPGIFVDRVVLDEIPRAKVMREVMALGRDPRQGGTAREIAGVPRDLMALRAARIIAEEGYRYVNLGVGIPTLVGGTLAEAGADAMLHAENGVLGYESVAADDDWDPNYYNAGGQPVRPVSGTATFDSVTAFSMARGPHLDAVVLGGYQVAENGDLANWKVPGPKPGGMGGAMDLVAGGAPVIVVMEHTTSKGEPRLVSRCGYPLTGLGCVTTVVTNLAVIDVTATGFTLRELAPGVSVDDVRAATACAITIPDDPPAMRFA